MSLKPCYCINPLCQKPDFSDNLNSNFCSMCRSELLLNGKFRVRHLLSDDSDPGKVYDVVYSETVFPKILKVLNPTGNSQAQDIELLAQEYTVLNELSREGITAIPKAEDYFEYPTNGGPKLYCLVMENVEGIDLHEWLKNNGKLNQNQALEWLREIVFILDKMHEKNYFHRDIKPHNIRMRNNGELVLINYGIARDETHDQQHGEAVAQSDFFALGRTFVHLLTGKEPLDSSVSSWREDTKNINPLLLDLIDALMAISVTERPQNTQEILERLDDLEQDIKQPQKPSSQKPNPAAKIHKTKLERIQTTNAEKILLAHTISGHSDYVLSVAFSPNSNVLASGSWDKTIKLWYVVTGKEIKHLSGHSNYVYSVAFISEDGKFLASGSDDKTIKLWEVETGNEIKTLSRHSNAVNSVAFSPDGMVLASGSDDKTIKLWEVETGNEIRHLSGHSHWVRSVAFSPDGKVLASGNGDGSIKLWNVVPDVENRSLIKTFSGHSSEVNSLAFSPDGKVLASGSDDKTIKLWDVAQVMELRTLSGHSKAVNSVAFSPDGMVLASGSGDGTIKLWDVENRTEINTLSGDSGGVNSVAFSPDGMVLASGSDDGKIKLWTVAHQSTVVPRPKVKSDQTAGVSTRWFRPK